MLVLITGAGGLVGATAVEYFMRKGDHVIALENGMRKKLLGDDGDTLRNISILRRMYPQLEHMYCDVRSAEAAEVATQVDSIIHCAAQPSHPKSIEIPYEDASINILGTLNILEALRKSGRKDVPFIFCSTNKVYGDGPNKLPFIEKETRYDFEDRPFGIDEDLSIDHCMHTPFGVSKVAADLYTQDYAKLYGLLTVNFRLSCITGPWSRATIFQNWIAFFMLCALDKRPLTIFGFKGKQVRDNIDARDLVRAFDLFIQNPRPGGVYNMGGGPENSVSCLETINRIEKMLSMKMEWSYSPEREGDHRIYISDNRKFMRDYPDWKIEIGLDQIFNDLLTWVKGIGR
jgi:CDP-paratose 2-epimerase